MNKKKILSTLKKQEEEKVGFSLKLPVSLKEQLQKLSETENVSMNALIVATLESMINDECGKQLILAKTLLAETRNELEETIRQIDKDGFDEDNINAYYRAKERLVSYNEAMKD